TNPGSGSGSVSAPERSTGAAELAPTPKGPAGLFLAFGGQPVGRAMPGADGVRAVGPEYGTGAVALAANMTGRPGQSIDLRQDLPELFSGDEPPAPGAPGRPTERSEAGPDVGRTDGAIPDDRSAGPGEASPAGAMEAGHLA